MVLEEIKKRRLARLLQGLTKDEISEIINKQEEILTDIFKSKYEKKLSRLKMREEKLQKQLDHIRIQMERIEQGGGSIRGLRQRGNISGRRFDELVMDILAERNEPCRQVEIRDAIIEKGLYDGLPTSLQTTIALTLRNLVRTNKIVKDDTKKYRLAGATQAA